MTNPVYRDRRWAKVRRIVLARDGHWCQIRLPGCKGRANSVDHVWELAEGCVDPFAEDNLQAACATCNTRKANHRRRTATTARRGVRQW